MRCPLRVAGTAAFLIASFCNAQTQSGLTPPEADAKLYSQLIRAEMKAGGLSPHDTVCLALPDYSDPSRVLLKTLKSDGLVVNKPKKCLFRGYEIRVEQGTPDSVHVQLVDVRFVDTDLAVILRDGFYVIVKDTMGDRIIRDYKLFQPSDKR
jgi:hypothetical protein